MEENKATSTPAGGSRPAGSPRAPWASAGGLVSAGALIGALIAGICGLDLYPESKALRDARGQKLAERLEAAAGRETGLQQDLEKSRVELRQAQDRLSERERSLSGLESRLALFEQPLRQAPPSDARPLLAFAARGEWEELLQAVHALLKEGKAGYPILAGALPEFITGSADRLLASESMFSFARLAVVQEPEAANFLAFILTAPELWNGSPAVAERLLHWSCQFLIGCRGDYDETRAMFLQHLDRTFEEGKIGLWAVLRCYDGLKVKVPADSMERLLENDGREKDHGILIKYLARRGDREAVQVLWRIVQFPKNQGSWKRSLALELLGGMESKEAEDALLEFVSSKALDIREPAYLAYFSRKRDADEGLQAIEALVNSDAPEATKRRVLDRALENNPEIFKAIHLEGIADPRWREELLAAKRLLGGAPR